MTIQIEEGKFYKNRYDVVFGPMKRLAEPPNPNVPDCMWVSEGKETSRWRAYSWRDDGSWHKDSDYETSIDLVAEASAPATDDHAVETVEGPQIAEPPEWRGYTITGLDPAKNEAEEDLKNGDFVRVTLDGAHSVKKVEVIDPAIRQFSTGATRDQDASKLDFEGFLSPLALDAFARYMHKNRTMADGSLRASDNWQKGIPVDAYMKSMWRHFFDVWANHRHSDIAHENMEAALCGLLFNAMGYLHEIKKPAEPTIEELFRRKSA